MKKILPMFLLLFISMNGWAGDVTLMCTVTDLTSREESHEEVTIREGDLWEKATDDCENMILEQEHKSCQVYYVTSTSYTQISYQHKGNFETIKREIDRVDGKYKYWYKGKFKATGKCVPFTAAF